MASAFRRHVTLSADFHIDLPLSLATPGYFVAYAPLDAASREAVILSHCRRCRYYVAPCHARYSARCDRAPLIAFAHARTRSMSAAR